MNVKDIIKNRIRQYYLEGREGYTDEALSAFVKKDMISKADKEELIASKKNIN